jgi:flagellar motility protein MotE (MotC chaperone)
MLAMLAPAALAQQNRRPEPSQTERDVLQALEARRIELDRRQRLLDEREAKVVEREAVLAERTKALDGMIEDLRSQRDRLAGRRVENVRRAARIYDAMRPSQAAAVLNLLEPGLAVEILRQMNQSRVPQILGQMDPQRARLITLGLTG